MEATSDVERETKSMLKTTPTQHFVGNVVQLKFHTGFAKSYPGVGYLSIYTDA